MRKEKTVRLEKAPEQDLSLADEGLLDGFKTGASLRFNSTFFEIDPADIIVEQSIGSGGANAFVFRGTFASKMTQVFQFSDLAGTDTDVGEHNFNEFERECNVFSQLRHPNILEFYGCSLRPPREYCALGDLEHFLARHVDFPFGERIRLLTEIASAISYLHSVNVIHRDLKPQNVLISDDLHSKLMDFGLSRVVDKRSVTKTKFIGTAVYMAPEVATNLLVYDERCDIYSFGIMMWVVITGSTEPYGHAPRNIQFKVAKQPDLRPPVDQIPRGGIISRSIRRTVIALMESCWTHVADARPSAAVLVQRLKELIATIPEDPTVEILLGDVIARQRQVSMTEERRNLSTSPPASSPPMDASAVAIQQMQQDQDQHQEQEEEGEIEDPHSEFRSRSERFLASLLMEKESVCQFFRARNERMTRCLDTLSSLHPQAQDLIASTESEASQADDESLREEFAQLAQEEAGLNKRLAENASVIEANAALEKENHGLRSRLESKRRELEQLRAAIGRSEADIRESTLLEEETSGVIAQCRGLRARLDELMPQVSEDSDAGRELQIIEMSLSQMLLRLKTSTGSAASVNMMVGKGDSAFARELETLKGSDEVLSALDMVRQCLSDPRALSLPERIAGNFESLFRTYYLSEAGNSEKKRDFHAALSSLVRLSFQFGPDELKAKRFTLQDKCRRSFEGVPESTRTGFGRIWADNSRRSSFRRKRRSSVSRELLYMGDLLSGLKHGVGQEYANNRVEFYGSFRFGQRHGIGVEYGKQEGTILLIGRFDCGRLVQDLQSQDLVFRDLSFHAPSIRQAMNGPAGTMFGPVTVVTHDGGYPIVKIQKEEGTEAADYFHVLAFQEDIGDLSPYINALYTPLSRLLMASHPNVVPTLAISPNPFGALTTEFDIGESVFCFLDGERFRDWTEKVQLLFQTALGMQHLHALGIRHGKLSWHCVYVMETPNQGLSATWKVQIGRYGLVDAIQSLAYTLPPTIYQASEISIGNACLKSDVFSFGMMMCELLQGTQTVFKSHPDPASLPQAVREGLRPSCVPAQLPRGKDSQWWIKLMDSCWQGHSDVRPTFTSIIETIRFSGDLE